VRFLCSGHHTVGGTKPWPFRHVTTLSKVRDNP
jgi:hypothetical protein